MRLLYAAAGMPIPGSHGGSVHALQLCRALARAGHEVHLACLPPERPEEAAADRDGVVLHPLRRALPVDQLEWLLAGQVTRVARSVRPELVIERFYTFGGTGLVAARRLGVPAVLEVNSPARPYPGSLRDLLDRLTLVRPIDRWRRWQLRQAAAFYTTGMVLLPSELHDRTVEIVNGVDTRAIRPGPEVGDDETLRLVYVSSFRAWHGAEDLVRAVALAVEHGADVRLVAVGDGPTAGAARAAAEASAARERIRFTGAITHQEVARELAAAHVGLAPFAPARHRALEIGWFWSPIKIFEYLAAGLPVVTADIPRLRELLPGEVGRFYPPGEPEALAQALVRLDTDRGAVRAAGRGARTLAERRYTWDHQAARVTELLERVASGTAAMPATDSAEADRAP